MMWPFRRKEPRVIRPANGNVHVAREALAQSKKKLREDQERSHEVDRLGRALDRALGLHR